VDELALLEVCYVGGAVIVRLTAALECRWVQVSACFGLDGYVLVEGWSFGLAVALQTDYPGLAGWAERSSPAVGISPQPQLSELNTWSAYSCEAELILVGSVIYVRIWLPTLISS